MEKYDRLSGFQQSLEEVIRDGARQMLHQAIENEVEEFLKNYCSLRDEKGHMVVKRNGYLPEREVQTGIGPIKVKKPVSNKVFKAILKYMRRVPSIDALIPPYISRGSLRGIWVKHYLLF